MVIATRTDAAVVNTHTDREWSKRRHRFPDAAALANDLERRWARQALGGYFGRLTLLALAAVLLIQVVQFGFSTWLTAPPVWSRPAAAGGPFHW